MKTPDSVIDLYAASAQVESQTRSENIKFGIQNRMRSGKTILNYMQFLSYTKGPEWSAADRTGGGRDHPKDF